MKAAKFFCTLACSLMACVVSRASVTEVYTFNPNAAIPDNSTVGVTDSHVISSAIDVITDITVSLTITGGWNGDYYAYLVHDSGFAVLLNRIDRTSSNTLGNSGSGMNILFGDTALNGDIHLAPNASPLTGTWQPDGRNVNPASALDTSPRTAFLASFIGGNGDGTWTLFVADVSAVSTGIFGSWTLNLTGDVNAIPEPSTSAATLLLLGGALVFFVRRARRARSALVETCQT